MTVAVNLRGLAVTAAFGVLFWAAADLRWAVAALAATVAFDALQLAGPSLRRRR